MLMEKSGAEQDCLTPAEVKSLRKEGKNVLIIDVRSPEEFRERHIPGAVNIPLESLDQNIGQLTQGTVAVTACGKGGGRSAKASEWLRQKGFTALWLCGGTLGWPADED